MPSFPGQLRKIIQFHFIHFSSRNNFDNLLENLDLQQNSPVFFNEDNESCIILAQSYKNDSKIHILKLNKQYYAFQKNGYYTSRILTKQDMTAEALTKPLLERDYTKHRCDLNLMTVATSENNQVYIQINDFLYYKY